MTVKLLSRTKERNILKQLKEAYIQEEFGNTKNKYVLEEIAEIRADTDWQPEDTYDAYDNLIGTLEEFPDCCGAKVLCGFSYRDTNSRARLSEYERLQVVWNVNRQLRTGLKLIVAILNQNQQRVYKDIFKDFGGERFGTPVTGNHGLKLYLWVFTKGKPRKQKRSF